jgi:hypothetical protein
MGRNCPRRTNTDPPVKLKKQNNKSICFGFCLARYNNNFKIKNKIRLTDMWTASCVEEVGEGNMNAQKSFVLGWPTVNFVATFR